MQPGFHSGESSSLIFWTFLEQTYTGSVAHGIPHLNSKVEGGFLFIFSSNPGFSMEISSSGSLNTIIRKCLAPFPHFLSTRSVWCDFFYFLKHNADRSHPPFPKTPSVAPSRKDLRSVSASWVLRVCTQPYSHSSVILSRGMSLDLGNFLFLSVTKESHIHCQQNQMEPLTV